MTLPRYAEYKGSGVAWLGELPRHWDVYPLKRELESLTSGSRGWAEHYADDGALFIRIGNLTRDSIELDLGDIQRVIVPSGAEGERTLVQAGDLLFSITAYLGSVAVVPVGLEKAFVSQHVALARLKSGGVMPRWAAHVAASRVGKTFLETRGYGGTKVQLSLDDVANMVVPFPPLAEQTAIVAFLDNETAKIDALIAEQEKLIALLAEKRQATISHAVTRGLDPDAPMKDSGVAWLGEVPAHWALPPLYLRYEAALGKMLDTGRITGQYLVPYLRNVDVQWDHINVTDLPQMDIEEPDLPRYTVRDGDLLVCEGGEVGRAAVARGIAATLGYQKALHRLRALTNDEVPRFMLYTLLFASKAGAFSGEGQSTIAHLTGEQLRKYRFPKPSANEQQRIVAFLDTETSKLDQLRAEALCGIALLKERRSALIAAAVTGQIDVRGAVQEAYA